MKPFLLTFFLFSFCAFSAETPEESKTLIYENFYGWTFAGTYGGPYSEIKYCTFSNGARKECAMITREDVLSDIDSKGMETDDTNSSVVSCYKDGWATCEVKKVLSDVVLNQRFQIYPEYANMASKTGLKTSVIIRATK
jgi:hypothetical protein